MRSSNTPLSAMILSFNHPEKLWACATSLFNQTNIQELLILENHSTVPMTDIYERLTKKAAEFPHVSLLIKKPEHALSYGDAQNEALNWARHPFVLLMNNDAVIQDKNALQTSVALMEQDESIGIVGHKIVEQDGHLNHFGCYHYVDHKRLRFGHLGRHLQGVRAALLCEFPLEVLAVTGAAMLVRKTALRFDSHYWFEYEDLDFCFQYRASGYRILCNPYCTIYHEESTSRDTFQQKDPVWIDKQAKGFAYLKKRWTLAQLQTLEKGLWGMKMAKLLSFPMGSFSQVNLTSGLLALVSSFFIFGIKGGYLIFLYSIGSVALFLFWRCVISRCIPFVFFMTRRLGGTR